MSFTCRTCRRTNPPEAQYCYFDGVALDGAHTRGPIAAGALPFPAPFVLPSGRSCRSFDVLVLACDAEWDDARSVLQKGFLEGFLGGLGRVDLAMAARQAAAAPDLDGGLDELLAKLPSTAREPAKLQVEQREIDLGEMPSGTEQRLTLSLKNLGMGLLQGTVSCGETPWLAVGDAPAGPQKRFQCRQDLNLPVHVVGKALRANAKPLAGKLVAMEVRCKEETTNASFKPVLMPKYIALLTTEPSGSPRFRSFSKTATSASLASDHAAGEKRACGMV